MQSLKTLGTTFLSLIALLVMIYVGSAGVTSIISRNNDSYEISEDTQWEIGRAEFMKGCDPDNTGSSYCGCTFTYLKNRHTIAEINRMGLDFVDNNIIPQSLRNAAEFCTKDIQTT